MRFKFEVGVHLGGFGVGVPALDVVLQGLGKACLEFGAVIRQHDLRWRRQQAECGRKGCLGVAGRLAGDSEGQAVFRIDLTEANRRFNRKMSPVRIWVEHLFRVIKRQFGYTKVRYKGLVKNAAQVFTLIGLVNLIFISQKACLLA